MRFERDGIDQIMLNIDVNNTINGGMIQTTANIEEYKNEVIISIKVPGISPDRLKLRVSNNLLLLMHNMNYEVALAGHTVPLTQVLRKIPVPRKAIVAAIEAVQKGNELIIFIPTGTERKKLDQTRDIDIK